ncbi:hypothetical protein D3C87_1004250 [compost metagenome]
MVLQMQQMLWLRISFLRDILMSLMIQEIMFPEQGYGQLATLQMAEVLVLLLQQK